MVLRLSVLLLSLLLAACASAPQKPLKTELGNYDYAKAYISWLIKKQMRSNDVTGLSIAVVDGQRVVWAEGFGYADLERKIPATPETVYQLGSIAKLFTASAVMQLAEQDKLDIDQPVERYIPDFSVKSRFTQSAPITLRNLLTHHSGLPANLLKGMSVSDPEPFDRIVDRLHNEYVSYPPNYVFNYSNIGMSLAGVAVERVSGEDFVSYMDEHMLQPLGMTHTRFSQHVHAKSYNNNKELPVLGLRDIPSSGLNSNALDMTRFMRMVLAGGTFDGRRILHSDTLAEMMRQQNPNVPLDFDMRIGLGWMLDGIDVKGGGTVVGHGGTTLNFQSMLVLLPEQKLGVIVLSNTASSHMVVNHIATETLQKFLEAKSGIVQPPKKMPPFVDTPLSPELLQSFSGYYDTMAGLVRVRDAGGDLEVDALGKEFVLKQRSDDRFAVEYNLFGLFPIYIDTLSDIGFSLRKVDGKELLVGKVGGRELLFGEKLRPAPLPKEMLDYVGDYEITGHVEGTVPSRIQIIHEGGMLIGQFTLKEVPGFVFRIAFQPVSDNQLILAGVGAGRGDTLRLLHIGNERRIRFSGVDIRLKGGDGATDVAHQNPLDIISNEKM
jgi:CubicO group peptidase (beta-lactamase class C family)